MKAPDVPSHEAERLAALHRYEVLDTPPERTFDALTSIAAHILEAPVALVSLVDAGRQWFKSRLGLQVSETPRDISFCGHVVASERPLVVPDATLDDRFADNPFVTGESNVRFYCGYPLRTSDGHVLGTLCVIDKRPRSPSARDLEFVQMLAQQAMDQLELRRQSRLATRESAHLNAILKSASDVIVVTDDQGQILRVNAAIEARFGYRPDELLGQNIRKLVPSHLRTQHDRGMAQYGATGRGRVIGVERDLLALRKDGSTFPITANVTEMRAGRRRMFAGFLRDATERKEAERKLQNALADLSHSQAELLRMLNRLRIGIALVAPDRTISFANDACLFICDIEGEDPRGWTWEDLLDVSGPHREAIRTARAGKKRDRARVDVRVGVSRAASRWVALDLQDDPRSPEGFMLVAHDQTDVHELRDQLARQRHDQILGDSPAMRELYELIDKVAQGNWTVLIEGETGTGKELVSRAVHAASARHDGPFIAVNCAGLTESILGSQLFGHVRGAFTGATSTQPGLFEAASGGTLFLDEIGDMPLTLQATLLRAIQEKEITRLGETRPRKVDTRIVAASNRDLSERVAAGQFREDLLYRIRGARIRLPALRERKEDIPLLWSSFLAEQRLATGKLTATAAPEVMERLLAHDWPGNVRELRAVVEYAIVRCGSSTITEADLPPEILKGVEAGGLPNRGGDERARIIAALGQTGGNRAKAARLLGIGRATLYRRLKEFGI